MRTSWAAGLVALGILPRASGAATYYSTQAHGEWSSPATWGGTGVPGVGDQAVITPGHPVNITTFDVVVGSLDIRVGTTLWIATGRKLTIGQAGPAASDSAADLNGDRHVDGADLAILLSQWSGLSLYTPCPPLRSADLNHDCRANGLDIAVLLASWSG